MPGPQYYLLIDGAEYSGWKSLRVTRSLEQASADFEVTVSERWLFQNQAWQVFPGGTVQILLEGQLVLTGYVDAYKPKYSGSAHDVVVSGRSKTCDFVDSSVLFETDGQFKNMTPGDLARSLARPFNLEVVSTFDGEPIADAQVQQGETCFALLERLCRLQEILVTDDAQGRLVLARASNEQSQTVLVQGRNILTAGAEHDDSERFSEYLVKAQRPANRSYDDFGETGNQFFAEEGDVVISGKGWMEERKAGGKRKAAPKTLTQISASVTDPGVTRYRPHVIVAEEQSDGSEALKRADWECRRRIARAKEATIGVQGWTQDSGELWRQNLNIHVYSPWLGLDQPLLIKDVQFSYGSSGSITELKLCLPDSLLPEPQKKTKEAKAKGTGKAKKDGGKSMWGNVIVGSGKDA
jgi:prophage tail gpP-like protein